jgi:hypothetical protein
MDTTCSSETPVFTRVTRRHIPEDGILLGSVLINVDLLLMTAEWILSTNKLRGP